MENLNNELETGKRMIDRGKIELLGLKGAENLTAHILNVGAKNNSQLFGELFQTTFIKGFFGVGKLSLGIVLFLP